MAKTSTVADEAKTALDEEDLKELTEQFLKDVKETSKGLKEVGAAATATGVTSGVSTGGYTSKATAKTTKTGGEESMNFDFAVGDYVTPTVDRYNIVTMNSVSEIVNLEADSDSIDIVLKGYFDPSKGKGYGSCLDKRYNGLEAHLFRKSTPEEISKALTKEVKEKAKAKGKPEAIINLKGGLSVKTYKDGTIVSTFSRDRSIINEIDDDRRSAITKMVEYFVEKDIKKDDIKDYSIKKLMEDIPEFDEAFDDLIGEKYIESQVAQLIEFFKEFEFEPNYRFVNTLAIKCQNNIKDGSEYIKNYFKLMDSGYTDAVAAKCSSPEFKQIAYALSATDADLNPVNKRLIILYGSQGTGKSVKSLSMTDGRCIVAHGGLLAQDLMEDFCFSVDGKPQFEKSAFVDAMENGHSITIEEANLMPMETMRFLQSVLDGKKSIIYKDRTINIKDGFFVVMNMNLVVNNMTFAIPGPIIDRAYDLIESKLDAPMLMGALGFTGAWE